jgi:chemotaxis protein methyltransferase CheR
MSSTVASRRSSVGMVDGEFLLTTADFNAIAKMLHAETGITLHEGKATLMYSRLGKRLRALGMADFRSYCELLEDPEGQEERGRMIRALTTNVTRFFREPHHFDHLRDTVLPPLLKAAERGGRVRIWSAACSSGQEPYSLALTVLRLLPNAASLDVRILATDIDTTVLEQAKAGRYSAEALSAVPGDLRTRHFEKSQGEWEASDALRRMITFRPLNLIGAWPMRGTFDVIMCRNVVIYFAEDTQVEIWNRFAPLLTPGGYLYIGHSERVAGPAMKMFTNAGITTYQKRAAA